MSCTHLVDRCAVIDAVRKLDIGVAQIVSGGCCVKERQIDGHIYLQHLNATYYHLGFRCSQNLHLLQHTAVKCDVCDTN